MNRSKQLPLVFSKRRKPEALWAIGLMAVFLLLAVHTPFVIASQPDSEPVVLAQVNGEKITEEEFLKILKTRHRMRSEQTTKSKDFRSLLEEMINDRLILQEGVRMGLDQDPEVQSRLEVLEKSAAAQVLIRKEVKEPVTLSEEEIKAYFEKLFERVHPRQIVLKTKEEADAVIKELQEGADFATLAKERSIGYKGKDGGDLGTFTRLKIYPPLEESVFALKVGETSQPIEAPDGFHIVRLEERFPADQTKWEHFRKNVESRLRSQKEKERYKALIAKLREKAEVKIYKEKIELIQRKDVLKGPPEKPEEVLAEVDGTFISAAYFWRAVGGEIRKRTVSVEEFPSVRDATLNELVERVLLRKEAERRNLQDEPEVNLRVEAFLRRMVKQKFISLAIIPRIDKSEEALRTYYSEHQERYREPSKIRLARITVSSKEKADELLKSLKGGTNFAWAVEHSSEDSEDLKAKGGEIGWAQVGMLGPEMRKAVENLPVGGMSEPVKVGLRYHIFYIKDKDMGNVPPFEEKKDVLMTDYLKYKVDSSLNMWADKLKAASTITMNEERLKIYEKASESQ